MSQLADHWSVQPGNRHGVPVIGILIADVNDRIQYVYSLMCMLCTVKSKKKVQQNNNNKEQLTF